MENSILWFHKIFNKSIYIKLFSFIFIIVIIKVADYKFDNKITNFYIT